MVNRHRASEPEEENGLTEPEEAMFNTESAQGDPVNEDDVRGYDAPLDDVTDAINAEEARKAEAARRAENLVRLKAHLQHAREQLSAAEDESFQDLPGDADLPPSESVDIFANPDAHASPDPLVNINANFVVAIRMFYAFQERNERFAKRQRELSEQLVSATYSQTTQISHVAAQLSFLNNTLSTWLYPESRVTRLRRWVHRKTADPRRSQYATPAQNPDTYR